MGPLTNDMTRLRDEIDALHNTREAFINDLKHDVTEMQSGFRNAHAEMASETKNDLFAFTSNLKANVSKMKQGFRNDHAEMARKLMNDLGTFVSGLEADVSDMKQGFRNDHAEMARKLMNDLGTFVSNLNETVANLRQEFEADIQGAHRAWFGQAPREHTTKKETERKSREEEARRLEEEAPEGEHEEVKAEPEKPEELVPDALTTIHGIGAGMERHLNKAGIYTFAQLARSTPEVVRNALGSLGPMTKVEKWIDHAKELVEPAY